MIIESERSRTSPAHSGSLRGYYGANLRRASRGGGAGHGEGGGTIGGDGNARRMGVLTSPYSSRGKRPIAERSNHLVLPGEGAFSLTVQQASSSLRTRLVVVCLCSLANEADAGPRAPRALASARPDPHRPKECVYGPEHRALHFASTNLHGSSRIDLLPRRLQHVRSLEWQVFLSRTQVELREFVVNLQTVNVLIAIAGQPL